MKTDEELAGLSTEGLEREICELGGHINAATASWLALVGSSTGGRVGRSGVAGRARIGCRIAAG